MSLWHLLPVDLLLLCVPQPCNALQMRRLLLVCKTWRALLLARIVKPSNALPTFTPTEYLIDKLQGASGVPDSHCAPQRPLQAKPVPVDARCKCDWTREPFCDEPELEYWPRYSTIGRCNRCRGFKP